MKILKVTSLSAFGIAALSWAQSFANSLKEDIIPPGAGNVVTSSQTGENLLDSIFAWLRDAGFALMAVIAIGMFLFIGGRLIMARGNPEEFKKAIKSFIYAAIWIFVVSFAWALVRIIAGLQL